MVDYIVSGSISVFMPHTYIAENYDINNIITSYFANARKNMQYLP